MKKVLKNILIIIVIVLTTLSIFGYTILNTTQKFISKDNIVNIIKKINIKDVLDNEIKEKIYETLNNIGIPNQYADYMLESEEIKEYVGDYIYDSVQNTLNGKQLPALNIKKTTDTLITSFNKVVDETNKNEVAIDKKITKEEQEKIIGKIEESSSKIGSLLEEKIISNINEKIDKETDEVTNKLSYIERIYKLKDILFIITIVGLVIIMLLDIKKFKFLKNIGIPFLINAILLFTINFIVTFITSKYLKIENETLSSLIDKLINNIGKIWQNIEIRYLLFFIITLIIHIIISKKYKEKEDIEEKINIEDVNIEN